MSCLLPLSGGGGGGYLFVACLSHLAIDHASLSRRSTVPIPNKHLQHPTFGALGTLVPCITLTKMFAYLACMAIDHTPSHRFTAGTGDRSSLAVPHRLLVGSRCCCTV